MALSLVCDASNDLPGVLRENSVPFECFSSLDAALRDAQTGSGILVLADQYPSKTTVITPQQYALANSKDIRLYVEFPSALPEGQTGPVQDADWERTVVSCDVFGDQLARHRILMAHGCRWVSVSASEPMLVTARVAGFDEAVFGLPEETHPILFEHQKGNLLVAATKLSSFLTARFAPSEAWEIIWAWILRWADPHLILERLEFVPTVKPSYRPEDSITPQMEREAIRRGIDWFTNARLLVDSSWQDQVTERQNTFEDSTGRGPEPDWAVGDGSCGMIEGANARILHDGKQNWRYYLRADCMGEASMAFGLYSRLMESPQHGTVSKNLIHFILEDSSVFTGPRSDQDNPGYGLLGWDTKNNGTYYGDDNARAILGMLAALATLRSDQWNEQLLRSILANFRTTGPQGFRGDHLTQKQLEDNGWKHFFQLERTDFSPHFESWMWACYLLAYRQTGCHAFLDRVESGIAMMIQAYPDQWRWTNGLQQERARMLLPLAWLIRVEDTQEHREYLNRILTDLLKFQDEHGGIIEELGDPEKGLYGPPKNNEEYGKGEAPLIQTNKDRLCDLLYTTNFAFIGLHEAAAILQTPDLVSAENKLADFLCRIQVSSRTQPELDGAWFRAFDLGRWEHWASNGDAGWGAWSIESGWTQCWILTTLMLRQLGTSLWDLTANSQIGNHANNLIDQMLA